MIREKDDSLEAKFFRGEINSYGIPDCTHITDNLSKEEILRKIYLCNKMHSLKKKLKDNSDRDE